MNTKNVLATALLLCCMPILVRAQLVAYDFESATFESSKVSSGVTASNISLVSGGVLSLGAGAAAWPNGPRGYAAVGNDFVDEGAFTFTVSPLGGGSLHITGLGFASLKEGSRAKGAKLYYKTSNSSPVFIGQFEDFASPPVINFDAPVLGGFYYGHQNLDLTFASSVELMIAQDGLQPGYRFAIDNVVLDGEVVPSAVPEASTIFFGLAAFGIAGVSYLRRSRTANLRPGLDA